MSSGFDDAYEDDPTPPEREEQRLGEAILNASIGALELRPAVSISESSTIREAITRML